MANKYRIRAVGVDKWNVEYPSIIGYWESVKVAGSLYVPRTYYSEREAEEYIQKRIEIDERREKEKKASDNFIAANPPREVPPFKFHGR